MSAATATSPSISTMCPPPAPSTTTNTTSNPSNNNNTNASTANNNPHNNNPHNNTTINNSNTNESLIATDAFNTIDDSPFSQYLRTMHSSRAPPKAISPRIYGRSPRLPSALPLSASPQILEPVTPDRDRLLSPNLNEMDINTPGINSSKQSSSRNLPPPPPRPEQPGCVDDGVAANLFNRLPHKTLPSISLPIPTLIPPRPPKHDLTNNNNNNNNNATNSSSSSSTTSNTTGSSSINDNSTSNESNDTTVAYKFSTNNNNNNSNRNNSNFPSLPSPPMLEGFYRTQNQDAMDTTKSPYPILTSPGSFWESNPVNIPLSPGFGNSLESLHKFPNSNTANTNNNNDNTLQGWNSSRGINSPFLMSENTPTNHNNNNDIFNESKLNDMFTKKVKQESRPVDTTSSCSNYSSPPNETLSLHADIGSLNIRESDDIVLKFEKLPMPRPQPSIPITGTKPPLSSSQPSIPLPPPLILPTMKQNQNTDTKSFMTRQRDQFAHQSQPQTQTQPQPQHQTQNQTQHQVMEQPAKQQGKRKSGKSELPGRGRRPKSLPHGAAGIAKTRTNIRNDADQPTCNLCNTKFARRSNLYKHLRSVHEEVRKFSCDLCVMKFKRQDHLIKHKRSVHAKVRKFNCDICGMGFAEKFNRDKHRRNIHNNKRPFRCNCGAYFQDRDKMLNCLQCKRRKVEEQQLAQHQLEQHQLEQHQLEQQQVQF